MSEYVIFMHGVNTREQREQPGYANQLIRGIKCQIPHSIDIKYVPLYWGDVNIKAEQALLYDLKQSSVWGKLAFQDFRAQQLLQFTGDAALYISRAVGQQVVERLIQQTMVGLSEFDPRTDHVHLVSHSMGTVIMFDMLFGSRWDAPNANGYQGVEQLRHLIFHGTSPIRSIHTMGSPISLFSLTMVRDTPVPNTHDITQRLGQYLKALCPTITSKFPWRNYLHPLDIIASPIQHLIPKILNITDTCLDIKDLPTQDISLFDDLCNLLMNVVGRQALTDLRELAMLRLALLAGSAHSSYWSSPVVVSTIVETISKTAQ